MSVSLLPRDVGWCDSETFLLLLQDIDVYRNVILMFEFRYILCHHWIHLIFMSVI